MLTAIIVAAGASRRMGFDKLFADLAGKPVVAHSIAAFQACPDVSSILVVTRPERAPLLEGLAADQGWAKLSRIVEGGAERRFSVWNGLLAMGPPAPGGFIAVHDGARPLVTPGMIARCLEHARATGAACCAAPVSDTLKRSDAKGRVAGSVERTNLWAMQTPQIFAAEALVEAYRAAIEAALPVTDEASAFEDLGRPVGLVDTGEHNLKVTYPPDLELAAMIIRSRMSMINRH